MAARRPATGIVVGFGRRAEETERLPGGVPIFGETCDERLARRTRRIPDRDHRSGTLRDVGPLQQA